MDFLEKLKQDPNCLYIYNWGPYIYGLDKEPREYLVITKNKPLMVACMEEGISYQFISINDWFEKVLRGDIRCWECACMNKKFIIKEHVKLMMSTNPLNLRKEIDVILNSDVPEQTSRELLIKIY